MYDKGNVSVKRAFIEKCEDGVVGAMGYAVAWTIENSIRGQGAIKASLKEVTGDGEEYTVIFTINNKDHSAKWVREYGNWRIRSFGAVAAGDKTLVIKKEAQKKTAENLRVDNDNVHIEAGYAYLFEKAPAALYASLDYKGIFNLKYYTAGSDFWAFGIAFGYRWGIPAGKVGFMPYIRFGVDYIQDKEYEDFKAVTWGAMGFPTTMVAQGGLKITTSAVPGLFMGLAFQYTIFDMMADGYNNPMKKGCSITAGYAF